MKEIINKYSCHKVFKLNTPSRNFGAKSLYKKLGFVKVFDDVDEAKFEYKNS